VPEDRDVRRVKTPPAGVRAQTASPHGVPVIADLEDTGMHVAPEVRRRVRNSRETHVRIGRLEDKHDAIVEKLADHGGKLSTIVDFMEAADSRAVAETNASAERAKLRAAIDEAALARSHKIRLALIGVLSTLAAGAAAWAGFR
jgi:hypothetical protein